LTDDQVNVPADMLALANSIGPYTNMRFATASARDATITVPLEGMMCWVADQNAYFGYDGTGWKLIDAGPLPAVASSYDANVRTITATTWTSMPGGGPFVGVTNPSPAYNLECDVHYGAWLAASTSDVRCCCYTGGAMVVNPGPGGLSIGWGQILIGTGALTVQGNGYGRITIPPATGPVNFALSAYRTVASGTQTVSYSSIEVVPRRYI
jgi:hypothetical protein